MNFTLLDKIESTEAGILATIISTEGHSYKKKGEKALFELDNPFPVYGNFGSQCVDQDLVEYASQAFEAGAPKQVHVDTTDVEDVHFGYGTYCGGKLDILLEPILDEHRKVYRQLRTRLEKKECCYLIHDLKTGKLAIAGEAPGIKEGFFVEEISAPVDVFMFGATPLAQRIATYLIDTDFKPHVIDWREAYLDKFKGICESILYQEDFPFDSCSYVLALSHSYLMDKKALAAALECGSTYVGMLSSKKRRDKIYEELAEEGISARAIARVRSPIGIDVKGRSDPEIAIGIVAELMEFKNT